MAMLPLSFPPSLPPPGRVEQAALDDARRLLFIRVQELTRMGQHAAAEALWEQITEGQARL